MGSLIPSSPRSDSWVGGVCGTLGLGPFLVRLRFPTGIGKSDKRLGDCEEPDASLDTVISLATCKLVSVSEVSIVEQPTTGFFFGDFFS